MLFFSFFDPATSLSSVCMFKRCNMCRIRSSKGFFAKICIHMHRLFRRNLHTYILWSCGIHMHSMTQMVNGQPQIHECRLACNPHVLLVNMRTESSLSVCGWSYGIHMHSMIYTHICGKALCIRMYYL